MSEVTDLMQPTDLLALLDEMGQQPASNNYPDTRPFLPEIRVGDNPQNENIKGILFVDFTQEKSADGKYPSEFSDSREIILLTSLNVRGIEEYEDRTNSGKKSVYVDCFSVGNREIKERGQVIGSALGFGKYAHSQSGGLAHACASCDGCPVPDGKGGTRKACSSSVLAFVLDVKSGKIATMKLSNTSARGPQQDAAEGTKKSLMGWDKALPPHQQGVMTQIALAQGKTSSFEANSLLHTIVATPGKFGGIANSLMSFKLGRALSLEADQELLQKVVAAVKQTGNGRNGRWEELVVKEIQRRLERAVGNITNLNLDNVMNYFSGLSDVLPMYDTDRMALPAPTPAVPPAAQAAPIPPAAQAAPIRPAAQDVPSQVVQEPKVLSGVDDVMSGLLGGVVEADFTPEESPELAALKAEIMKVGGNAEAYAPTGSESPELLQARTLLLSLSRQIDNGDTILVQALPLKDMPEQLKVVCGRLAGKIKEAQAAA